MRCLDAAVTRLITLVVIVLPVSLAFFYLRGRCPPDIWHGVRHLGMNRTAAGACCCCCSTVLKHKEQWLAAWLFWGVRLRGRLLRNVRLIVAAGAIESRTTAWSGVLIQGRGRTTPTRPKFAVAPVIARLLRFLARRRGRSLLLHAA